MRKAGVAKLLDGATATGSGSALEPWYVPRSFEAYGTTASGSGSATVIIEVRNSEDADYKTLCTLTLVLATTVATGTGDGFASSGAAWRYVRARVSAISGSSATVYCNAGSAPL